MLSIAIAIALTPQLPPDMRGVYTTQTNGPVFVLTAVDTAQAMINDRHYSFNELKAVPDGSYLGVWFLAKSMRPYQTKADPKFWALAEFGVAGPTTAETAHPRGQYPFHWNKTLPLVLDSNQPTERGEIRIVMGRPDHTGKVRYIDAEVYDLKRTKKLVSRLHFMIPVKAITMQGAFADEKIKLELADSGGVGGTLQGKLTYLNTVYLVGGSRSGARGSFYLTHSSTGRYYGHGYAEWTPSGARQNQMAAGSATKTDMLHVNLSMPEFPNGSRRTLVEAK